jgi:hypothetical protein
VTFELIGEYAGPAVIRADGHETAVTCTYEVYRDLVHAGDELIEGLKRWNGTFRAQAAGLLESGAAVLELPDGRTGEIVVDRVKINIGTPGARGGFLGNGDEPA